jgi:hypothetical protein
MNITHMTYPTPEHYEAAVFVDSLRWARGGPGVAGTIANPVLEVISIALVRLTNRDSNVHEHLHAIGATLDILDMIEKLLRVQAVFDAFDKLQDKGKGDGTPPTSTLDLDGAFGMEDWQL